MKIATKKEDWYNKIQNTVLLSPINLPNHIFTSWIISARTLTRVSKKKKNFLKKGYVHCCVMSTYIQNFNMYNPIGLDN